MKHRRREQGLTLIETLLAMGISAVVIAGLAAGIYAILSISGRGNDHIEALRDIQSAAHWINYDGQMANSVTLPGGSPSSSAVLTWKDSDNSSHTSTFTLTGSELERNFDGTVSTIGWNISSVQFTSSDDVLSFTIISTPTGMWNTEKQLTGKVTMRAYP